MADPAQPVQVRIDAYLRERAGLARRGATDRVAEVDVELAALGYQAEPAGRTSPPRQTATPRRRRTTT